MDEIEWWEFDSAGEMAEQAAGDIGFVIESALEAHGGARLALSTDKDAEPVYAKLAQVETVKRFALLPKELDHEEGELTATQKVKRAAIAREFSDLIEGLYE